MPSHYPSLNSSQESYQLIGNKNKAGVLLGICFFSNEAEEPLLCLVVSTVGYPEEIFAVELEGMTASLVTCVEDTDAEFS